MTPEGRPASASRAGAGPRPRDLAAGSGTVAAVGLSCTGIEAGERWCRTAASRLATPQPAR